MVWNAPSSIDRTPAGSTPTATWAAPGASGSRLGEQSFYGAQTFQLWDDAYATVNLSTGNFELHSSDLGVNGPGLSLNLDRFYNSQATGAGSFGTGGSLSLGRDVGLVASGSTVTFHAPSGFTATFTSNGSGGWTAPSGLNADLVHNSNGTWSLTYRKNSVKYTFTTGGYLSTVADRNGVVQTLRYWSDGRLASITDTAGRVTNITYTSGRITQETDPAGRAWTYGYDGSGNLTSVTDPSGGVTNYTWDSGKLAFIQDPRGNWSEVRYDTSGRVASFRQYKNAGDNNGNSAATFFTYTPGNGGAMTTDVKDPRANTSTFVMDSAGRVTKTTDPLGRSRYTTWTTNSDVQSAVDAMGTGSSDTAHQIAYSYATDGTNNLQSVTLPTGAAAKAQYGNVSGCSSTDTGHPYQVKCSEDDAGNQTTYSYDTPGNVATEKSPNPAGGVFTKTYTHQGVGGASCGGKVGQLCTATDGRGGVTSYAYDTDGNLVTVTPPAPLGATTYTYDSVGRVTSVTDGKGQTTTYSYDKLDHRTQTVYTSPGGSIVYVYDADGNLTTQYDSLTAASATYSYDTLNRQITKQLPGQTVTQQMGYDENGNLVDYVDETFVHVRYSYDAANELTSLAERNTCATDASTCTTFDYYANGNLKAVHYPGGVTQTTTWDNSGRATEIKATGSAGTLTDFNYAYNSVVGGSLPANDRTRVQRRRDVVGIGGPANSTTTYAYDSQARLASAVEVTSGGTTNASWTYSYDANGNRTRADVLTGGTHRIDTWAYNAADQLTTRNGSTSGWAYDANGNETLSPGSASVYNVQPRTDTHNPREQLTSLRTSTAGTGGTTVPFTYFGATNFERTGAGSTPFTNGVEGIATFTNSAGSTLAYTRMPNGTPISMRQVTAGVVTSYYYLTDNLGSVIAMTDQNGAVVAKYGYDPAGNTRTVTGAQASNNALRFTAGYRDSVTGLYKLGYRYYDPSLGRFTQPDPTGQEANAHLYGGADPVNKVDIHGAEDCLKAEVVAGVSGAAAGVAGGPLAEVSVPGGAAAGAATGLIGAGVACEVGNLYDAIFG
ncbi:RHS repeat domain-containing protein [Motilibacter peucedani]|uniref:RHS repeat domain-containing protein n=1 Tax=Motilibacter peucedani TaxID=598650 RepID=UPI0015FEEF9E|nr:RHS repeat-associated core domain-containing protein [Motilibacter peucedani]